MRMAANVLEYATTSISPSNKAYRSSFRSNMLRNRPAGEGEGEGERPPPIRNDEHAARIWDTQPDELGGSLSCGCGRFCPCCQYVQCQSEDVMKVCCACITCVSCCDCMSSSGLCNCFSYIFQPFVWAWKCLLLRFTYKDAALYALQLALQCVQFWTPLSVTFLVLWLLYRPDRFHPYVDDAVLAALDLTHDDNASSSHLQYDLSVGLSFRNSHSRLSIRYLDAGATAFYNGTKLGSAVNSLPSFHQPPKNTTVWRPAFQGAVTTFPGEAAAQLGRELAAGVVHVRVGVYLTLMYKVWPVKDVVFYKYDCWLWFALPRKDAPALFHGNATQCWRV